MMMRWSRITVTVLVCGMLLAGMPRGTLAQTAGTWGFEAGTLAGWSIVSEDNYVGVTQADEFREPVGFLDGRPGTAGSDFDGWSRRQASNALFELSVVATG